MAWSERGEARVRRFTAYKSLEARLQEAMADAERLNALIRQRDRLILELGAKVRSSGGSTSESLNIIPSGVVSTELKESRRRALESWLSSHRTGT